MSRHQECCISYTKQHDFKFVANLFKNTAHSSVLKCHPLKCLARKYKALCWFVLIINVIRLRRPWDRGSAYLWGDSIYQTGQCLCPRELTEAVITRAGPAQSQNSPAWNRGGLTKSHLCPRSSGQLLAPGGEGVGFLQRCDPWGAAHTPVNDHTYMHTHRQH